MKRIFTTVTLATLLSACSGVYCATMEKFGVYKRDILVDRIEAARDAQGDTKARFKNTLEQFNSMVSYNGSELEAAYKRLNSAYENSAAAAKNLDERIKSIELVAADLFDKWEDELDEYNNAGLRADSKRQLQDTRREYQRFIRAMKNVQSRIPPVLGIFHDQVLSQAQP